MNVFPLIYRAPIYAYVALAGAAIAPAATNIERAQALAEGAPDAAIREELGQDIGVYLAQQGNIAAARAAAAKLPPGRSAIVLLELAAHLPNPRGPEAEQLAMDAQTAKALTNDWRKARVARLLAGAYARLGKFDAAIALAHTVPDTEEKAFALQDVTVELNRSGQVAQARTLASAIEENRRYGTYRQKAAALADTAHTLHARGNPDDAATLLAQAELLLPKKPGWSDGGAFRDVAVAAHACQQTTKAVALLSQAESLAQQIAGPWRVTELARLATAWHACGETQRASERLAEATEFLAHLTPLDRAEEAPLLARMWAEPGVKTDGKAKALAILAGVLAEADLAGNGEAWRKPRVRALLARGRLTGQ